MQIQQEHVIYQGSPSQMVNFKVYSIYGLMFLLALMSPMLWDKIFVQHYAQYHANYLLITKAMFFLPVVRIPYAWLSIRTHQYRITTERFMETRGIFSRTTNEMELFRVRDITFLEPFVLRLVNCGHIVMDTSDKSTPVVALRSIKNAKPVMELLRKNIGIMRARKGVREVEI